MKAVDRVLRPCGDSPDRKEPPGWLPSQFLSGQSCPGLFWLDWSSPQCLCRRSRHVRTMQPSDI